MECSNDSWAITLLQSVTDYGWSTVLLVDSVVYDGREHLHALGILVSVSQDHLNQQFRHGLRGEKGRFCCWSFKRNFPHKIIELSTQSLEPVDLISALALVSSYYAEDDWMFTEHNFYVRLYFSVSRKLTGYFKSYASDRRRTEIRFHSDDWIPIRSEKSKIINHSRVWRYFLHEAET